MLWWFFGLVELLPLLFVLVSWQLWRLFERCRSAGWWYNLLPWGRGGTEIRLLLLPTDWHNLFGRCQSTRSGDISPLGTRSTLLRSNRSVVALLTDVAFLFGAVPSARMVICTPHDWCHLWYNPMHYIRVTCVWWCWYYLPIVLGGAVSARLLLSNTSQYCWLICVVTVQHLLMFRGAVSAKFGGGLLCVPH